MKQKVLAIAGCIAATAPSASIADVLPKDLVGLNLGEIRSSTFLNQPFKGVIPFLFTSYESSKNLEVRLASQSIFNEVGAEKHPILNNLNFQVTRQNNKPVILISSDKPITLPFLNFILEIKSPESVVYQDYTVLLDPETQQHNSKQISAVTDVKYIEVNSEINNGDLYETYKNVINQDKTDSEVSELSLRDSGNLLLASLSSEVLSTSKQNNSYRVKSGDSLSKIAQQNKIQGASLKTISKLIYQKNPKAFIRGDINRLKKGFTLRLPTVSEIEGFDVVKAKPSKTTIASKKPKTNSLYIVKKGDSLSKITKKFAQEDVPFTKMMDAIYSNNPSAFINRSKNQIKTGAKLAIPAFSDNEQKIAKTSVSNLTDKNDSSSISNTKSPNKLSDKTKTVEVKNTPQTVSTTNLKPNQYRVNEGETLSYVANKIGYKDVPFATMLNEIFLNNPDAFDDGRMTHLIAGSVITLPPKGLFKQDVEQVSKPKPQKSDVAEVEKVEKVISDKVSKSTIAKNEKIASPDLTKRIRELRKELRQAKESLSDLKSNLSNKEILLEQKNIQLKSLNTMLTKYNKSTDAKALEAIAIKTNANQSKDENTYKPKSKAEMAKIQREQLNRKAKTKQQIEKIEEISNKSIIQNDFFGKDDNSELFKDLKLTSMVENVNSNHAYLTLALLLGLLLIRYRRALYSYTYSKIKYDQPKYYPVPDSDKYDLKERNLNFHDPKMDEEAVNYDLLNEEKKEEFVEDSIIIDPNLVEAKEEVSDLSDEAQQIEHCESLVTELFGDIEDAKDSQTNSDWENIEKFCDSYIDKIKDSEESTPETKDNVVVEEATDFNNMMTDLLESLDKVDKSVKRNNISFDDDIPDLIESFETDTYKSDNHTNS